MACLPEDQLPDPPAPPGWCDRDFLATVRRRQLEVEGATVAYRVFPRERPVEKALVFVHGGRAHSRWWDATISALLPNAPAVALDISGHGDSSWRSRYSAETWINEVAAVVEQEAPAGCTLVGHSLGGGLALRLAQQGHPLIAHVVSVDAAPGGPPKRRANPGSRSNSRFAARMEAVEAFMAAKRSWPPWLASYVANHSVTFDASGWRWKHDPATRPIRPEIFTGVRTWACPVTVVLGGASALTPGAGDAVWRARCNDGGQLRCIELPGVGHDIMMEGPLVFSSLLQRVCLPVRPAPEPESPVSEFEGMPVWID